jgi:serine/threonine protein kinase
VADLRVKDEWVGPGEKKTAEHLRDTLPDDWVIFAGRKLAGENRDDVDLIVVGRGKIFVLDEKSWGPRLVVDDSYWYVNGHARQNPLGRVGQLSRKLATKLKTHARGYKQVPGKRVVPGIVLSHDNLQIFAGRNHDISENVWQLAVAEAAMLKIDRAETPMGPARNAVIAYLDDLPSGGKIQMLGEYRVDNRMAVPGKEQAYEATDSSDRPVVLKCYPVAELEEFGDPNEFLRRETKALNKLAGFGRAWQALPFFRDEAYGLFVVPVVRPTNARSLAKSLKDLDPERPEGRLPDDVARNVVIDAYTALAEVHAEGLVHRALDPGRIWLGRALRVMFSDFHLARIDGAQTIVAWEPDEDSSNDYRAPECAVSLAAATPRSDVFSLSMCLIEWLLGEPAPQLTIDQMQVRLVEVYPWAAPMGAALADSGSRPSAEELAVSLTPKPESHPEASSTTPNEFRLGGLVGGRYRIEEKLGEGGFAVTWKVFDNWPGHHKVLKQFKTAVPETLREEYQAANQLNHDCCGRVYDMQIDKTPPYLVQEYVEGQSLDVVGINHSLKELRQIAENVLTALAYVHAKDLLHGDVTPANIVASNDGSGLAKLIDFGLTTRHGERPHGWTPKFAAPEVLDGKPASPSSDLFGFAASLSYAMLGRPITRVADGQVEIVPLTHDDRQVWGEEGEAFLQTLLKGVQLNPSDRPASASEFLSLLRAARLSTPSTPPITSDPPVELTEVHNEAVTSIRRLYRGSVAGNGGNRGLDDQFAVDTYVPTALDNQLLPRVLAGELDVVLLSGNPGDGKTAVLVKLGEHLRSAGATIEHEDEAGWRMRLSGRLYTAVYDASESHGDLSSDQLVSAALDAVIESGQGTALIAVNDGRLLQFFDDHGGEYETWGFDVKDQVNGKETPGSRLAVVDLKRRSLASEDGQNGPALNALKSMVNHARWEDCSRCVAQKDCPILANRDSLKGQGAQVFDELVRISHLRRRRRATFRDVRSAIAWLITGDRSCDDIHRWRSSNLSAMQLEGALISELAFSTDSSDYLVAEWAELDPARVAAPGVDRLFRTQGAVSRDPVYNSVDAVARGLYFELVSDEAEQTDRASVMSYRYLEEFTSMLRNGDPDRTRSRLLLGMSRLVGAFGYTEDGLAMSSGMPGAAWAILHTVPSAEFTVSIDDARSPYVETIADQLTLKHESTPSITLSLDTAEIILRAADGELVNDLATDAILEEIEAFVSQLARRPSMEARIVDSSGSVAVARVDGTQILLEDA